MTSTLERFPNVFCDNCRKVQPMIFDVLEADEKNTQAAADIVCAECKSIMATLYAARRTRTDQWRSRCAPPASATASTRTFSITV